MNNPQTAYENNKTLP